MRNLFAILFVFIFAGSILAQDIFLDRPGNAPSVKNQPVMTINGTEGLLFAENFNGSNSVAGLEARGWVVINQDGGGTTAPWYQGSIAVFNAYEGPDTGYVASNYNGANGFYIDHWLISPIVPVAVGDTLTFWHRSPDNSIYDDSLYVRVSPTAGTTIPTFTVASPRFRTSVAGWAKYTYIFTVGGNIRFAIHYQIFNGGVSGSYSDYMGIDDLQVRGQGIVPVELTSFSAKANGNTVNLNWATATETNNRGFEIQKKTGNGEFATIGFVAGNGTATTGRTYTYADKNVDAGTHTYRLRQIDLDGTSSYSGIAEVNVVRPNVYAMNQNFPNPFNPSTAVNFSLAVDGKVSLKVFNVLGQEVATLVNGTMSAGNHTVTFDASNLQSGVYFARIEAAGIDGSSFSSVKKMILNK